MPTFGRPLLATLLVAFLATSSFSDDAKRQPSIDFTNDIAPIFTKYGCNGGGCHGKATGRGGFKLSLFGFEPKLDYASITRGGRGRRVFAGDPDRSLLLQKPLMLIPHGGGRRLKTDQPEYKLLRRWIAVGMPWGKEDAPRVTRLEVSPKSRVMRSKQSQPLHVTAIYTDGSKRDVTRLTEFRSNTTTLADVSFAGVITTKNRTGETAIAAQYQGLTAVCLVTLPNRDRETPKPKLDSKNLVDRYVETKLRTLNVPPSSPASDSVFLRRATVQIAGRLPTLTETKAFLSDKRTSKRAVLIDRLLKDPGYADVMAQKWSALLRNKRRGQEKRVPGTKAFHKWIRESFAKNKPYDKFVREILTATGSVKTNPPAQWYAEVRYLDRYVDDTAQVFLGIRIGCARCHHHPFENFSQDDYYGLAAFFARVGRTKGTGGLERASNETIFVKATGDVKHPATGNVVLAHGLGTQPIPELSPCEDPRRHLADWMTAADNPYFAKAFVNRLWGHFFGRGLVDPLDDMRSTNPPANAPLLDALAKEFVRSKFNVKQMVRLIGTSRTYQLSATPNRWNLDETQAHSRFYPQRFSAELLLDAIDTSTAMPTTFEGMPKGTKALQLPDEGFNVKFLKMFGRPERMSACECERDNAPTLRRSMFLMNDRFVLKKIYSSESYAGRLAKDGRGDGAKLKELFLKTLSRPPRAAEIARSKRHLKETPDAVEAWGDLLWALINTREFSYVR